MLVPDISAPPTSEIRRRGFDLLPQTVVALHRCTRKRPVGSHSLAAPVLPAATIGGG